MEPGDFGHAENQMAVTRARVVALSVNMQRQNCTRRRKAGGISPERSLPGDHRSCSGIKTWAGGVVSRSAPGSTCRYFSPSGSVFLIKKETTENGSLSWNCQEKVSSKILVNNFPEGTSTVFPILFILLQGTVN